MSAALQLRTVRDVVLKVAPRACDESVAWLGGLPKGTTPEQAWQLCEDAGWMLWFAAMTGVLRRAVIEAACDLIQHSVVAETAPMEGQGEEDFAEEKAAVEEIVAGARAWAAGESSDIPSRSLDRCAPFAYAAWELLDTIEFFDRDTRYLSACALADVVLYLRDGAELSSAPADIVRARVPWRLVEAAIGGAL